jgi:hypothetical protein
MHTYNIIRDETNQGAPVTDSQNSLTIVQRGPVLYVGKQSELQPTYVFDRLSVRGLVFFELPDKWASGDNGPLVCSGTTQATCTFNTNTYREASQPIDADRERITAIRQLVSRTKRYLPQIKQDIDLLEKLISTYEK